MSSTEENQEEIASKPSSSEAVGGAKRGRKKAEITVLKEIIARLPPTHIAPVITLVKKYCEDNKLKYCVDPDKERKELEALCKEKNLDCLNINEMNLSAIKSTIRSISTGDLKSKVVTKHITPKKVAKIIKHLEKQTDPEPIPEETELNPTEQPTADV